VIKITVPLLDNKGPLVKFGYDKPVIEKIEPNHWPTKPDTDTFITITGQNFKGKEISIGVVLQLETYVKVTTKDYKGDDRVVNAEILVMKCDLASLPCETMLIAFIMLCLALSHYCS
jgi:hypothetical protein